MLKLGVYETDVPGLLANAVAFVVPSKVTLRVGIPLVSQIL
jgi:hypothetical protein